MGQHGKEDDTERAIRLRDNKRRHRQRQREYVTDLEQKLAESRAAGIQATKEVQAAARQVVWENSRLRQILRDQGLSNDVIESLIYKDGGPYVLGDKPCLLWGGAAQTQLLASHHVRREPARLELEPHEQPNVGSENDTCNRTCTTPPSLLPPIELEIPQPQADTDFAVRFPEEVEEEEERCRNMKSPTAEGASPPIPPCKILTILAGNPGADITQLPTSTSSASANGGDAAAACEEPDDGVECLRAREVLMSYATSEKNLDEISQTLEKGCVKNKSGGGCHVKKDVLWSALDRIL